MIELPIDNFQIDFSSKSCGKPWNYCNHILNEVSRTFALNIQVLPTTLKKPVLLAYLFCRMADTIEDDPILTGEEKDALLSRFKDLMISKETYEQDSLEFHESLPQHWKDKEKQGYDQLLTLYPHWVLVLYFDMAQPFINAIQKWVLEMCDGMAEYSKRKPNNAIFALDDMEDLDKYCYYVAGTVGYMLTDLFYVYSPLISVKRFERLSKNANSFGLGLQLTNIIKDVGEDKVRGIHYIPSSLASKHNTTVEQILDEDKRHENIRVMREMILKALHHLEDAVEYTTALPILEAKMRTFCLWPLFMATATLIKAVNEPEDLLLPDKKVKITRKQVKDIVLKTTIFCFSNWYIKSKFKKEKAIILKKIEQLQ